ncbi:MAG: tetratricopeptide repeat protein [Planctomycetota bacterium]
MYEKGAFKEALVALCDVMVKQPQWSKDGGVYTLWAELEMLVNDNVDRAMELLDRAREVGGAEIRMGNYEKAIQNYEQCIAIEPSVSNLRMLAQALSDIDDSRAIDVWQQVLEKDPENCLAHACIGFEAEKSGDRGKAILMAKRAEKLNPSAEDAFTIARLYYEVDEFQSAINACLVADRLGYKDKAQLYAVIAACHLSLGQATPARKYVEWALGCDPKNEYAKEVWHQYQQRFGGLKEE